MISTPGERLAHMLERQGREPEVEQVWRDAVTAGDLYAGCELAALLER
jgi:hypothetical protein